jgi:hypothetical protein
MSTNQPIPEEAEPVSRRGFLTVAGVSVGASLQAPDAAQVIKVAQPGDQPILRCDWSIWEMSGYR